MEIKTVEINGTNYAELFEGKPIFTHQDGREIPFDAPGAVTTISRLNAEAKGHREAKEAAQSALKAFEGIEDAEAARKALKTVGNLDAKKLVDAGEVDKVKAEAVRAFEEKLREFQAQMDPVTRENSELKASIIREKIGGAFLRSKLIAEKLVIPPDMVQARFGDAFKLEDDSIVAYDHGGGKIYSRIKPGDVAGFDEALEILIDGYPHRDNILKGSGASGSGAHGGNGAAGKGMSRAQWDLLDPIAKRQAALSGNITD